MDVYDKKFSRTSLASGIGFTAFTDERFKVNRISINFITEASEENTSFNSFLARILTSRTQVYPEKRDLTKATEKLYGAGLYGDAYTFGDAHNAFIEASSIDDRFSFDNEKICLDTVKLLFECLEKPLFENFEPDIKAQLDDIESIINDKRMYAMVKAKQLVYKDEFAANRPLGTAEIVKSINAENLKNAFENMLKTANIEIIVIGRAMQTEETEFAEIFDYLKTAVDNLFKKYKRGFISTANTTPTILKKAAAENIERMEVTQGKLVMGFKTDLPLTENKYALFLANKIFGGGVSSKLFRNVREKKSLCYYCSSAFDRLKGAMFIQSGVDDDKIELAKTAIFEELKAVQDGHFSDEDLDVALRSVKNDVRQMVDSQSSIMLSIFSDIYTGNNNSFNEEISAYEKVTKEEIITAAKSFILDGIYELRPQT